MKLTCRRLARYVARNVRDEKYTSKKHKKTLKEQVLEYLGVECKFQLKWVLRNMVVIRLI